MVITEKAVAKHLNSLFTKLDLPVGEDHHYRATIGDGNALAVERLACGLWRTRYLTGRS